MVMVLLVGLASLTLLYQPLTDMLDVQQNDNNNLILIGCSSHDKTKDIEITTATNTNNGDDNSNENSEGPDIVWLMSFPNRYVKASNIAFLVGRADRCVCVRVCVRGCKLVLQ